MKKFSIISILILFNLSLFSQTVKNIELKTCIDSAIKIHPLSLKKDYVNQSLQTQHSIGNKSKMPALSWNGQAKIQSESIGLTFDNPNIPAIEIPLYSAQSTLDLKYVIYNGNATTRQNDLNSAINAAQLNQIDIEVDKIKQDVLQSYLSILFTEEKEKVLLNAKERIQISLNQVKSAVKSGVAKKDDLLLIRIREKELENEIFANSEDRKAEIKLLESLTGIHIDETSILALPEVSEFKIDPNILRKEMAGFDLEKNILDQQAKMVDLQKKPRIFAFATAGTGYPNPLNFFDDNLGLFAVGGIGFSWQFFDWGKAKKEKSLLKIKQQMVDVHKRNLEISLNRYNEKFAIGLAKISQMIQKEKELIELREEVATIQKIQVEKGVLLSNEYLNTLNEITASRLKLSAYDLQLVKLKLEYQLLKGNL